MLYKADLKFNEQMEKLALTALEIAGLNKLGASIAEEIPMATNFEANPSSRETLLWFKTKNTGYLNWIAACEEVKEQEKQLAAYFTGQQRDIVWVTTAALYCDEQRDIIKEAISGMIQTILEISTDHATRQQFEIFERNIGKPYKPAGFGKRRYISLVVQ